jgi:hypothetical protein
LLENGAISDFTLDYGSPSDGYKKLKFYSLTREYALFNRIKDFENSNDIKIFDAYFSEFSNGYYASETEKIFRRIVEKDYAQIRDSETGARPFLKKYSGMGQNVYLITANVLNIREGNSIKTGKTGKYIRGQQVFALSQKDGWLRTDRGWISAKYAKHVKRQIPVLASYSEKVASKLPSSEISEAEALPHQEETEAYPLESDSQKVESPARKEALPKPLVPVPNPRPQKARKESRPLKAERSAPLAKGKAGPVQAELNALLENASLSALEAFISKYKKNRAYRSVVQQAKDAYKRILLGTE